jgi:hypothetical protein
MTKLKRQILINKLLSMAKNEKTINYLDKKAEELRHATKFKYI